MVEGSSKGCYLLPSASAWRQGARQDLIEKKICGRLAEDRRGKDMIFCGMHRPGVLKGWSITAALEGYLQSKQREVISSN